MNTYKVVLRPEGSKTWISRELRAEGHEHALMLVLEAINYKDYMIGVGDEKSEDPKVEIFMDRGEERPIFVYEVSL